MRERGALLFAFLALILLGPRASADEIVLKSGGRVQGDIVSRDDTRVVLQTAYGSVTFDTADILEVKQSSDLEKEIRAQLKNLQPSDTATRLKLATKAADAGLADLSKNIYTQVVAISGDDKTARQALGYVQYEGEWVTLRDKNTHEGLVPYHGQWVTAEERDGLRKNEESGKYFAQFGLSAENGASMAQAISDIDVAVEPRGGYIVRKHVKTLPVKDKPYVYSVDVLNWQRLGIFVGVSFIDSSRKRTPGFGRLEYKVYATDTDALGSSKIGKELLSETVVVRPDMWLKKSDFKYWDTKIGSPYEKVVSDEARKAWSTDYFMNNDGILYILANRDIDALTPPGVYYVEATFTMLDKQKKVGRYVQYAELR
jgi:hypothetical protein